MDYMDLAGAFRQQAIIWSSVDADLCHFMVSQGHNELMTFCVLKLLVRNQFSYHIFNNQNMFHLLNIKFIFDLCQHSLYVVTPVKYESDLSDLINTFALLWAWRNNEKTLY